MYLEYSDIRDALLTLYILGISFILNGTYILGGNTLQKLYYKRKLRLSVVLEAEGPEEIRKVFDDINMPQASVNVLIINAVIPFFYAYGRYRGNSRMQAKALKWLAVMPAEDNKYTRKFKLNSSPVADPERSINTAADSQAIIQLVTRYCERRDCLRCQLGYQYIKKSG